MDNLIRKILDTGSIEDIKPKSREVVACISTDDLDRDHEVVVSKGLTNKVEAGKSVVMVNHKWDQLPIGKSQWVKCFPHKVLASYKVSENTQSARDVFGLLQDGTLTGHSVGFESEKSVKPTAQDIEERPDWKAAKLIHKNWNLLEYSAVGIPANPNCLTLAVGKGYCPELITFIKGKAIEEQEIIEKAVKMVDKSSELNDCIRSLIGHLKHLDINSIVMKASTIHVNGPGVAHAKSLASAGRISHGAWDQSSVDRSSSNSTSFLGIDSSQDPKNKGHWKFPVISNGQVNRTAVGSAAAYAEKNGYSDIHAAATAIGELCDKHEDKDSAGSQTEPVDDGKD